MGQDDISPVWAIVPARMGSERLPGKSMAMLCGKPSLGHIAERLRRCRTLDGIAVATTEEPEDDVIARCAQDAGIAVFRGSVEDVMGRTLGAARSVGAASIVTVTGDCPLIDPAVVDDLVGRYRVARPDYACNFLDGHHFPRGMDVEAFRTSALAELEAVAHEPRDREHVTLRFYERPENCEVVGIEPSTRHRRPELRLTLDTTEDLELITALYEALYPSDPAFGLDAILDYLDAHPELQAINAAVQQKVP